nr:OmpH family outer membrane protein [uncultured Fluviicola sp.]
MKKGIYIGFTILIVTNLVLIGLYFFGSNDNTAYFEFNKVYNDCSLKKKLEADLEKVFSTRKNELDSLQLELSLLSGKIEAKSASGLELQQFEDTKNRFLTIQDKYEQENMRLKENYTAQIRKEINEKARLFAEQRGYTYLFAATGDGTIMYGSDKNDVTKDFQKFIDK